MKRLQTIWTSLWAISMSVLVGCASIRSDSTQALSPSEVPNSVKLGELPIEHHDLLLFYFTDRKIVGGSDPDSFYANQPGPLSVGTNGLRYHPETGRFTYQPGPDDMPLPEWKQTLTSYIHSGDRKEAILIFVHGYNQSFADAAHSTAILSAAFGPTIVPAFYSWPSRKTLLRYTTDEDQVLESSARLSLMLREIRDVAPNLPIFIVAHSLGARVTVFALEDFHNQSTGSSIMEPFTRGPRRVFVALLAADIKRSAFATVHHPKIRKGVDELYIYVSKNDAALAYASRIAHVSRERRLGDASEDIFVSPESFTIDVSRGDKSGRASLGHGYFSTNRLVTFDLVEALRDKDPPSRRQYLGRTKSADGQVYWFLTPPPA